MLHKLITGEAMSQENQNVQEELHKRRVRYKGKYPRNYKEKYKELNPEKYQDTIEKVIRKAVHRRECIYPLW